MDKWNEFFTLYNAELAAAYDKTMEGASDEDAVRDPDFQEMLRNQVLNSMQAWYKRSFPSLEDKTPEAMVDALETVEETISRIRMAAVFCDDEIPEYLKIKLGSFGTTALPALARAAMSPSWESAGDSEEAPSADILGASAALKILGEWQAIDLLEEVVTKFIRTGTPHELITDAFKCYITGIGEAAIPYLLDALEAAIARGDALTGPYEYIIIALTLISRETRPDKVYACLRGCFRNMLHKVIGAICVGDYGDPRGIALLKGYLDRNAGKFDRQEFYEILSSIKRLGGTTHDIHDPFRDFSARV